MVKLPVYQVLSFIQDGKDGCALTVLAGGAWYHVTAKPARFQDSSEAGKRIAKEYRHLLSQLKTGEQMDENSSTGPKPNQDEGETENEQGENYSAVDVQPPLDELESEDHAREPASALHRWILRPVAKSISIRSSTHDLRERTIQDWYHCHKYYFDLLTNSGELHCEEDESPTPASTQIVHNLKPSMSLPKYIRDL